MESVEVLVVGGGVIGCSIALRLAQAGAAVTLVERSGVGAEASSAAAGILAPQLEADAPGPFLDLCLRSSGLYPAFAAELRELCGIDVGYRTTGVLQAAFSESAIPKLQAMAAWQSAFGLRASLLSPAEALRLEPKLSPRIAAAVHLPDDHQVDTRQLVRAVWLSAGRLGVSFRIGSVRSIAVEAGRAIGADIDGEVLRSNAVVIAAGSWSSLIEGVRIDSRGVKPMRGQMVQFLTQPPILNRALIEERGYVVPRSDGRVLAGSTFELAGYEKRVTAEGLSSIIGIALELCPTLAQATVQDFWSGLRPYTDDHLPILGAGPVPGLYLATGHFRTGILLAPATARLVSDEVLGKKATVDLTPFRWDRNPPLGSPSE